MNIDPDEGYITLDFTDNIDCVQGGMNMDEATVSACAISGVLNNLDPTLPHNGGAFSRIKLKLREGCVVGHPKHPVSASMATTNVADRLLNMVQSCFAKLGKDMGMADGSLGMPASASVVSGTDWRRGNAPYIRQAILGVTGGPAVYGHDGWITYGIPVTGGVIHLDSIEIDEVALPILFERHELITDSSGPGRWRGAAGTECRMRPRHDPGMWAYASDGHFNPPKGASGGQPGRESDVWKYDVTKKERVNLPHFSFETIQPNEMLVSESCGGGGFGDALERDHERVRWDVREGYVSLERARDVYGVVLDTGPELYAVNYEATDKLRKELKGRRRTDK
jgi:N-methylhydantoinase B